MAAALAYFLNYYYSLVLEALGFEPIVEEYTALVLQAFPVEGIDPGGILAAVPAAVAYPAVAHASLLQLTVQLSLRAGAAVLEEVIAFVEPSAAAVVAFVVVFGPTIAAAASLAAVVVAVVVADE